MVKEVCTFLFVEIQKKCFYGVREHYLCGQNEPIWLQLAFLKEFSCNILGLNSRPSVNWHQQLQAGWLSNFFAPLILHTKNEKPQLFSTMPQSEQSF
jgi:hypothetical protein